MTGGLEPQTFKGPRAWVEVALCANLVKVEDRGAIATVRTQERIAT